MLDKLKAMFGTAPKLIAWKIEPAAGGDDCYRVYLTTEFDRQNIAMRHAYIDYSLSRGLLDKGLSPEPPETGDEGVGKSLSACTIAFNALWNACRDIPQVLDTYEHLAFAVVQACESTEKMATECTPEQMAQMALKSAMPCEKMTAGVGFSCVEQDGFFVLLIGNESAMSAGDEERVFAVIYTPGGAVQHVALPKCADAYKEGEYQYGYVAAHMMADKILPDEQPATMDAFKESADKFLSWFTDQCNSDEIDLETLYGGCVASHPENRPAFPVMTSQQRPKLRLYISLIENKSDGEFYVFFTPEETQELDKREPETYLAMKLTRNQGVQVDDHKGREWAKQPGIVDSFTFLGRALESLGRYPENYDEFTDIVSMTMQNYQHPDGTLPTVTIRDER